jgi:hypothetical protein
MQMKTGIGANVNCPIRKVPRARLGFVPGQPYHSPEAPRAGECSAVVAPDVGGGGRGCPRIGWWLAVSCDDARGRAKDY